MKRTALFAGSFDPFTLGHKSIVDRTLGIADEVVVGIGVNEYKHYLFPIEKRVEMIKALYSDNPNVKVMAYNGLTTDFAKKVGADFLVRGVRTSADYEFEMTLSDINRRLIGIETVLLITESNLRCVSSSSVRELLSYHKDVKGWVPDIIYEYINSRTE